MDGLYLGRGEIYFAKGDYLNANEDFNSCLHYNPAKTSARSKRVFARWRAGDRSGAIADQTTLVAEAERTKKRSIQWSLIQEHLKRAILLEQSGRAVDARDEYINIELRLRQRAKSLAERAVIPLLPVRNARESTELDLTQAFVNTRLGNEKAYEDCLHIASQNGWKKTQLMEDFCKETGINLDW